MLGSWWTWWTLWAVSRCLVSLCRLAADSNKFSCSITCPLNARVEPISCHSTSASPASPLRFTLPHSQFTFLALPPSSSANPPNPPDPSYALISTFADHVLPWLRLGKSSLGLWAIVGRPFNANSLLVSRRVVERGFRAFSIVSDLRASPAARGALETSF